MGSVPGWGTKIPHALRCGQNFFKNERGESISKPKIWLYNKYDNTINDFCDLRPKRYDCKDLRHIIKDRTFFWNAKEKKRYVY